MLKKPICCSYREYVELREAYKALLADNQKLQADNRELRDKLTNMEIKVRILEEDRPRVAYKCDGRACKDDCDLYDCKLTTDINHAVNFKRTGAYYAEIVEGAMVVRSPDKGADDNA